jgi:hypothetical protein
MASNPIYEFYAQLRDYQPKMWRRFQVANNITMARLGYILMTLFEMQANHPFRIEEPSERTQLHLFVKGWVIVNTTGYLQMIRLTILKRIEYLKSLRRIHTFTVMRMRRFMTLLSIS